MAFPYLFSPIKINKTELGNRIVMTAMHLGYTPEGEVTDQLLNFYKLRAMGGVGLIIIGGCLIDEFGGMRSMIRIDEDRFIPGLMKLTREVKSHGAKIAAQLYQAGRYAHSKMIGGKKPVSASAVRSKLTGETPRPLELVEIPMIQENFAKAAARAKEAGFDAVEILGSAGYLISQFLSSLTNKREDRYGGSLENRMRFGLEVTEKVRKSVGPDYPVLMRLAGNDFMEGGNTNRESRIFATELERNGIDLFNVTGGWHETRIPQLTMSVPRQNYVYLAQGIKAAVSSPVLASNRINDPEVGEEIIRTGQADMVTMARGLIADPFLPQKAREGNADKIYHCIACNQGCFDKIFELKPATCLVNPGAGRETEFDLTPTASPKKILIIGGGPAGMKAACTAAERGHKITLVEKSPVLGGQLLLNRHIPGRSEMITAATDLINNIMSLNIKIMLDKEADSELIREMKPDAVVLATGARPILPDISGTDHPNVVQAWDLLEGKARVGTNVAIVGGNAVGLETALFLAYQGTISPEVLHFLITNRAETFDTIMELLDNGNKKVTVLEMTKKVGQDIGPSTRWTVKSELKRLGVKIVTQAKVTGITEEGVLVQTEDGSEIMPADSIVLAAGSLPENSLASRIKKMVPEIHIIGDSKEPRTALAAIEEGFFLGLKI